MNSVVRTQSFRALADQFAALIEDLVPNSHVYTPSQRVKFDALYRELSKIDEKRGPR